jgi:hypothetical protein
VVRIIWIRFPILTEAPTQDTCAFNINTAIIAIGVLFHFKGTERPEAKAAVILAATKAVDYHLLVVV